MLTVNAKQPTMSFQPASYECGVSAKIVCARVLASKSQVASVVEQVSWSSAG